MNPNLIVGQVPQYANGSVALASNMSPIDAQGNFSIAVPANMGTQLLTLRPQLGSPYGVLPLTVTVRPGKTNVTKQAQDAISTVGVFIGIPDSTVATNDQGFAIPSNPSSAPTWGKTLIQFGDSITWGAQLGAPSDTNDPALRYTQSYGSLIATDLGLPAIGSISTGNPTTMLGIPGDTSADIFSRQIALSSFTKPTLSTRQIFTLAIGTNDVAFGPGTSYASIFRGLTEAALAYICTPREYSVLPGDAAFVLSGGTSNVNPFPNTVPTYGGSTSSGLTITGSMLSANGNCTITQVTEGNPLYLFYIVGNSITGSFSLAVDGVGHGTFQSDAATVSTNASGNSTVFMVRVPCAAGVHTVSITGATGTIGIIGTATIPQKPYANKPVVAVADIFPQNTSYTPQLSQPVYAALRNALDAGVTELQQDGADIRYVLVENYLNSFISANYADDGTGPGGSTDDVHLSAEGHQLVFEAFSASLLATPYPTSSGGGGAVTSLTTVPDQDQIATLVSGVLNVPPASFSCLVFGTAAFTIPDACDAALVSVSSTVAVTLPNATATLEVNVGGGLFAGPSRRCTISNIGGAAVTIEANTNWSINGGNYSLSPGSNVTFYAFNSGANENLWFPTI